ncbi:MAG TPA: tetratricopeptide repeat protein [Bacteroidia bacterium]|jgi:tetratricopeptide (TPR) repeat protein|nr:tetratricopeptide repeat protein [Bacteroidia bacterium]
MKSSKLYILLVCILLSFQVSASDYAATFTKANDAYAKKEYSKAIELYESIVSENQQAAPLFFNLGNAYFQTGDFAHAILNYERAKKLNPDDEATLINLKFANQKTEDKIEVAPELFLIVLQKKVITLLNEKSWSLLCIFCLIMGLVLFGVFIASSHFLLKKAGFYLGTVFLILFIVTFFIAKSSYNASRSHDEAIVMAGSVTVLGSPSESSTKLFILHKGSKVVIKDENDGWMEVKIANGNVGWIKNSQVEKI